MLAVGNVERVSRLVFTGHDKSDAVIYLHDKDQQDALFSLNLFQ
jgi:hypothetical protein